jgi:hypothetical protein
MSNKTTTKTTAKTTEGDTTATTETTTETTVRYEPRTWTNGVDTYAMDISGIVVGTRGYDGDPQQRVPYPEMTPQRERMQTGKPIVANPDDNDIRLMKTFGAR